MTAANQQNLFQNKQIQIKHICYFINVGQMYLLLLAPDRLGGCHALQAGDETTSTSVVKAKKKQQKFDILYPADIISIAH